MMQASEKANKIEVAKNFLKLSQIFCTDDDIAVKEEKLDQLLKEGVDINSMNSSYGGGIYIGKLLAAQLKSAEIKLALSKGLDPNLKDSIGETPLMNAIASKRDAEEDRLEVIRHLLDYGAKDFGESKFSDRSIWTLAENKPTVLAMLKEHFNQ